MLLKRKRSEGELSLVSSCGLGMSCSSPVRSDNGDVVMMDIAYPNSPHNAILSPNGQNRSRSCTPSHLPSRTFKRLRNGRPTDQEVHQNTLQILYQAQQQQQQQQPHHVFSPPSTTVPIPSMPSTPTSQSSPAQKQPSLHSFWRISTPQPSQSPSPCCAPSTASCPSVDAAARPMACEDCGVGLGEEDPMMDDGYGFETYINTCSACSRAVCFSCSVSNLGEQRRCLLCAGREGVATQKNKKWVGGLGWTSGGGVTVC